MAGDDQRTRQRGHNGKARGYQRGHMHRRFGNADHRPLRQFAGRQQSRIAETGDDVARNALLAAGLNLLQHADGGDGFIKMAFNGRHPFPCRDRHNLGPRRRRHAGGGRDGVGHPGVGVGINHLYTNSGHQDSLSPANSRAKSGRHSPARSKQRLATICSKWCVNAALRGGSAFCRSSWTSCW